MLRIQKKLCVCFVFQETKTDVLNGLSEIQYDENEFPNSLNQQIFKRYVKLRLNIYAQKLFQTYITSVQYASKITARSFVNNFTVLFLCCFTLKLYLL